MKRLKKITGFALLLVLATVPARAQLSLDECRKLALDNSKALKAATEQERAAYYQKREALMNFFPKVSAMGAWFHLSDPLHLIPDSAIPAGIQLPATLGGGVLPVSDELRQGVYEAGEVDLRNTWVAGVNLMQPLFAGGKIVAYNDLRACALDLAGAMKETKTADVIVEVDETYWQVVSLTSKRELAASYVELLTKLTSDIEAFEKEGMATKADVLSVKVKLNEAELALMQADDGMSLARMLLRQICGIEAADSLTLAGTDLEKADAAPGVYDADQAVKERSEIRSLALAARIADRQKKIAYSDYLPTVGLTAGYNWMRPNFENGVQRKFGGMWDVGVAMSVPLNFGASNAKHNAARAQARKAQYELEQAEEKVRLQISRSGYKLAEADKKLAAATRSVEHADENLRYANAGFSEGVIPASDVLSAHTAWLSAHAGQIDARIDLKLCKLYLDKALGRTL